MYIKLIIFFSVFVFSINNQKVDPLKVKPLLSEEGKRTLRQNLSIVESNIEKIKQHREKVLINIKMVENELKELSKLESTSLALLSKFKEYLDSAQKRISKNDEFIKKLDEEMNKQSRSADNLKVTQNSRIEGLEIEKRERLLWQVDSNSKLAKLKATIQELENSYNELGLYRGPILEQLRSWQNKEKVLTKMLTKYEDMKQAIIKGEYSPF